MSNPVPFDESRRLAVLEALGLLDTDPEQEFDALVGLAAEMTGCPTALLTLIDRDRQWIKAKIGSDLVECARDAAFCNHTIRQDGVMLVSDATADARFAQNPLVLGDPHIRFYAGAPIRVFDADGDVQPIGALCVIDGAPRQPIEQELGALTHLATLAEALIAARDATREAVRLAVAAREREAVLKRQERTFQQAERLSLIGSWRYSLEDESVDWSDGVYRIHEVPFGTPVSMQQGLTFYPPASRAIVSAATGKTIETGESFEFEVDFVTAAGRPRRVRSVGELELRDGRPVAIIGVFQDVTDRFRLERSLRESASIDPVTRIANRAALNDELEKRLFRAQRDTTPLALALIDLDKFKQVNDQHGHLAGDEVLRAVGQRLRAPMLRDSFPARLGGDEFALIVTNPKLVADLSGVMARLLDLLKVPVQSPDALLPASATIGSALAVPGMSPRELMHAADTALYEAKRAERGTYRAAA